MKLFRNLVVAVPAIFCLGSEAAVITYNSTPDSISQFYTSERVGGGEWSESKTEIVLPKGQSHVQLSNPRLQKIEIDLAKDKPYSSESDDWRLRYDIDLGVSKTGLINPALLSLSGFDPTQFVSTPLQDGLIIGDFKYPDRDELFVGLSYHSQLFRIVTTESGEKFFELAILSTNITFDKRTGVPEWAIKWQVPSHQELMNVLKFNFRIDSITVERSKCEGLWSDECFVSLKNYQLLQSIESELKAEVIPLSTTASFLLLGVAGLALRRRLTA